jgi:hypothetical protein
VQALVWPERGDIQHVVQALIRAFHKLRRRDADGDVRADFNGTWVGDLKMGRERAGLCGCPRREEDSHANEEGSDVGKGSWQIHTEHVGWVIGQWPGAAFILASLEKAIAVHHDAVEVMAPAVVCLCD